MSTVLALDQGTTSSRAILFDRAGQPVHVAQQEFAQHYPKPGWVEHDPSDIWTSQIAVAQQIASRVDPADIRAIGLTNQRETTVIWDRKTGEPIGPAIVWQDRRTSDLCSSLRARGVETLIRKKTGLLLDAYFSGTKIKWMLDNIPDARRRAARGELAFGTIDTWLVWKLTGGRIHVTDPSNASRTLLFNLNTMQWDDELLSILDIPRDILPAVVPSSGMIGETDPVLFGRAIPIAAMIGDQQGAAFGQACLEKGMAKNTYGTGCFLLANTGSEVVQSQNKLITTVGWSNPSAAVISPAQTTYCLEASIFMGGATIQWLRDGLQIITAAPEVEQLASEVPDTGDVYLVPAFTGLGAPHWDAHARGTLIGMTRGSGRAHIARAALEAIALQVVDVLSAIEKDAGMRLTMLRADGGAAANNLLMQMQADLLGIPVARPKVTETTALGAAYLAGLATGLWSDVNEIEKRWQLDRCFEPTWKDEDRLRKIDRWHQAVERAKAWSND